MTVSVNKSLALQEEMSEVIPKSSKKLNIFVMDRDSAHLQSIRKSFKKLKVKNKVSL